MVDVAEESPFAAVVVDRKLHKTCSNCFTRKETIMDMHIDMKKCAKCRTMNYCSKTCQTVDWKFHKDECNFLVRSNYCPDTTVRIISRVIMRIKRGDLPVAFNGRTFNDLTNRKFVNNEEDSMRFPMVYLDLVRFMGDANVSDQNEVISLYKKIRTHSSGILDSINDLDLLGQGIYIGLSVHKHSCRPDCNMNFIGPKAVLRAKDPHATYTKDLVFCYYPPLLPRKRRQEHILRNYFFHCQCERCLDEEEALWERSGKSSCCPNGVVLPRSDETPLICSNCKKASTLTVEEIDTANETLLPFCDSDRRKAVSGPITPVEVNTYIKLFDRMKRILSPYNLHLLNLAAYIKIAHLRLYMDYPKVTRFLNAQDKAVDRYAPFGLATVMFMLEKCLTEKCAVDQAENSVAQMDTLIVTLEKFCTVLTNCFGPEHPLTAQIQEEYTTWREKSQWFRGMTDQEVKRTLLSGARLSFMKNFVKPVVESPFY